MQRAPHLSSVMSAPGARVEPSESQPTRGAVTKADGGLWGVADVTKLKERARTVRRAHGRVIHPRRPAKVAWDLFVGVLIIYTVIVQPFRLGLSYPACGASCYFDCLIDIPFTIDIALCFVTGYYVDGEFVSNYWKIAVRYARTWMVWDVVSVLPFQLVLAGEWCACGGSARDSSELAGGAKLARLFKLVRLIKLVRLFKLSRVFSDFNIEEHVNPSLLKLLSLIVKILFLAHYLSCIWYFLRCDDMLDLSIKTCPSDTESTAGLNSPTAAPSAAPTAEGLVFVNGTLQWDTACGLRSDRLSSYIASLYWTTATMFAIGYGEIVPKTIGQRLFAIIVQLCGALCFGLIISTVTDIVETLDPEAQARRAKLDEILEYVKQRNLPSQLRRELLEHFDYRYMHTSVYDEVAILEPLPPQLRLKVALNGHINLIQCLSDACELSETDPVAVADLMARLQPFQCSPSDTLVSVGQFVQQVPSARPRRVRTGL